MTASLATPAAGAVVSRMRVGAYTIPADAPESDGGARMGTSPQHSVIDADHRVCGVPNLFVCGGSVMPTQGAANPALTIIALASRLGELLGGKRIDPACEQVAA